MYDSHHKKLGSADEEEELFVDWDRYNQKNGM